MNNNNITETGPQSYKQIQDSLNKFLTVNQRKEWVSKNLSNLQTYNVDLTIGTNGIFTNKDTERLFRDAMFIKKYGSEEYDNVTSPQERDKRFVQDRQAEMVSNYGLDKVGKNIFGFPVNSNGTNEVSTSAADLRKMSPDSLRSLSEANTGLTSSMSDEEKWMDSVAQNRYINDWDGSLMEDDIETLKREAPNLSNYYREYVNGNNPYIKEGDIDWETLAQEIVPLMENGNYSKAENAFNRELMRIMSENQSSGEKIGNWSKRFIANVGFIVPEMAGLVAGVPEAVISDLLIPAIKGEDVNWSQVLATATYDSYLDNLVYKWGEQLRENNPIYTGTPEGPLLDPESAAFMAKLAIPMKGVSLFKGISTVGKTGNALKKATNINKLTGYNRNLRKAEKNFAEIMGDASSVQGDRLRNIVIKAQGEGKSITESYRVAQEALADVYQAGSIQKGQIMLASYLESRAEAKMAQEGSKQRFNNAWDKQVRDLTTQALEGEIDLSDVSYNLETAENYRDQLIEEGYLDEIVKHMKSNPEASKYTDEQIEEAALKYLEEEAITRAKVDYYADSSKEEFDELKDKNANMAGLVTLVENYLLLRLTEGLGGWTTKLSPYRQVSATLREQKKGLAQNTKEFLGGVRTIGSTESQLLSRMAFDDMGYLKRVVTPKSVAQTLGGTGGVFAVENFQELGQELISSGTEGTSVHNAENFILSHIAGPGNDFITDTYQNQWLSFFQHAGFDRNADDYMRIIKATSLQMAVGVPSLMKYSNKFSRVKDPDGKMHLQDNVIRGGFENKWSYLWKQMESWLPINSPFLHNISEVVSTNTDVNTFISTYNKLLDDSRRMGGFASSSLNYSISALQAALDNDETSYDHSLFAARTAESIFLAMAQNKNKNRANVIYYQNLADINTKRDGESDAAFNERRQNTLKQIREDSNTNSVQNADDETLIAWAEETGKNMLASIDDMSKKMKQLYEEYDGNISWEHMYAMLYNNALYDYTKEKLDTLNVVFKNALGTIINTEITEEDVKNNKGKKIYNEQELLMLSPMQRYGIMQKSTGKQQEIAKSLEKQLTQYAADNDIKIDIKATLESTMKEDRLLQEAAQEKRALIMHPNEFLNRIRSKKQRIIAGKYFELIKKAVLESETSGETRSEADIRADISDALSGLASNGELLGLVMGAVQTLPKAATIVHDVLEADLINEMALGGVVGILTNEEKAKGIDNTELYKRIIEKIRNSHVSFHKIKQDGWDTYVERGLLKEFDSEEEQKAWENIMNRVDEAAKITPKVEVSEDASAKQEELDTFEEDEESLYTEEELKELRKIELKNSTKMSASEQLNKLYLSETEEKGQLREILNAFLNELDYNSYEDLYNSLTKAIEKAAANKESIYNEDAQSILKDILRNLKNTLGEGTDIQLPYIRLANPSFFIREHPDGVYARFFKKYNILNLLRGGKLLGKKVYVVWDKGLNDEVKEELESQNIPPQVRHIGLVAVVEGVIEGYEANKITIDGKDYTRIGLFRAYGTGRHVSSKDTVSYLISNALGMPFRENDAMPDKETFLLKDSFVIAGIDEPIIRSTIHENAENPVRRSLKSLIEERVKSDLSMEPESSKDPKSIAKRTVQWFLDHIKVHRKEGDNDITQAYIEDQRNNRRGKITIPIQTRNVSETPFSFMSEGQLTETTIGAILKEIKELILTNTDEQYISDKYDSLISSFPLFLAWNTILKTLFDGKGNILNSFMKRWDKEDNKEALLEELNEKFTSILNDKRGNTLYNRLTIPAYHKYYITYIKTDNDDVGHFAIGVKHEDNPYLYQGNIIFAHYSPLDQDDFFVRGNLNVFPTLNNFDVLKSLVELILNEKGEVRKSNAKDEFVKWQLNYDDIEKRKGHADQLLADLLNIDALTIKTESLVNYPIEVKLLPETTSIQAIPRSSNSAATEETIQTKEEEEQSIAARVANTLGIAKYDSNKSYSQTEGLGIGEGYFVEENCVLTYQGIDNEEEGIKLDFIAVTPTGRVRLRCSNEKDQAQAKEYLLAQGIDGNSIEFHQKVQKEAPETSSQNDTTSESKEEKTSKFSKEDFTQGLQAYVEADCFNIVEGLLDEMKNMGREDVPDIDADTETKIQYLVDNIKEDTYEKTLEHLENAEYESIVQCCLKA